MWVWLCIYQFSPAYKFRNSNNFWAFCKGYVAFTQYFSIFKIVSLFKFLIVFWSRFLHRTTVNRVEESFSLFAILAFDPNWLFCKGYSLCIVIVAIFVHFQNGIVFPALLSLVYTSNFYVTTFMRQFCLLVQTREIGQFLCDKYICWKAGVLAVMWRIKIVIHEKLLV